MNANAPLASEELLLRVWRFANCEFDELRRELRVAGKAVELESKPLEVLRQLLLHAGEVVTKDELLESVWPGVMVVDGSLATAVSKLRKAFGDGEKIVATVSRVGYRLAAPVEAKLDPPPNAPELNLRPGDPVPGRDQWRLARRLDLSLSSEVWLADHPKTRETRVFKFAADSVRLKALKREVTLARVLREALGDRADFVRILEWNFETAPYYLESEYAGPNLGEWAQLQGGIAKVPLQLRLRLVIDVARAIADAHAFGVLHKDIKPANLLIATGANGEPKVKVADFGSGALLDISQLGALGITNAGFTQSSESGSSPLTGTVLYIAPEVLSGQSPSIASDVYALGVLLYQFIVGEFRKPLSPGWEAEIEDPVLRQDIAEAAAGDPARRLSSAAQLAERLETLDQRRARRDELESAKLRAQVAERKLAAARARRPWVVLAVTALAVGFGVSVVLYVEAARERDRAKRETAIASSINEFLSDDLLGRGNPFQSGSSSESLMDAIRQASPAIDRKFQNEPLVAAGLHHTIARALDNRTDYPNARQEYERAATLFRQTQGELSQDAVIVRLQRVTLEARSYERGSLGLAKSILVQQESLVSRLKNPRPEIGVWLASARGMVELIGDDAKGARDNFSSAVEQSERISNFDEIARLTFRQRLAFSYIRLGDGPKAEQLLHELIPAFTRTVGAENPSVLRLRLNLAQAYMIQNKHAQAVQEANSVYPAFVARLGPDHELTMQLLTTRAQSEGSMGIWSDAIRDDLAIHDLAVRKQGPMSFFAVATLSDASLAMCRSGRYTEGASNSRKAFDASTRAFGPRAGLTGGVASTLSTCLIGLGQLNEAAKLLEQIDIPSVAQLAGDPEWGAGVKLLQAQIAYRRKEYERARSYVHEVTPIFTRPNAEVYQQQALRSLAADLDRAQKN
jgi:eukaryotic-like serine/threonine-protein kinase